MKVHTAMCCFHSSARLLPCGRTVGVVSKTQLVFAFAAAHAGMNASTPARHLRPTTMQVGMSSYVVSHVEILISMCAKQQTSACCAGIAQATEMHVLSHACVGDSVAQPHTVC